MCPESSRNIREVQCASYNNKPFMGRFYEWEPFAEGKGRHLVFTFIILAVFWKSKSTFHLVEAMGLWVLLILLFFFILFYFMRLKAFKSYFDWYTFAPIQYCKSISATSLLNVFHVFVWLQRLSIGLFW